jgi:hypothetical protein
MKNNNALNTSKLNAYLQMLGQHHCRIGSPPRLKAQPYLEGYGKQYQREQRAPF